MMATENKTTRQIPGRGFPTPSHRNESGAALITSLLFMVVLLSLIPVALQFNERENSRSNEFKDNREAFFLAEAGLEHAKFLVQQSSIETTLAGPDDDPTTTIDNGTFGGTPQINPLNDGFNYNVATLASTGHNYYIRARDNDDGDGDPTRDTDFLITLSAVGIVDGVTSTVEATVYHPTFPTAALTTNGNTTISGTTDILGACGNVHSNDNLTFSGTNTVAGTATATGALEINGVAGTSSPKVPIPRLDPTDYQSGMEYTLAADGNVYATADLTTPVGSGNGTNWNGWTWTAGDPSATPPLPAKWVLGGSNTIDAALYVQGDVNVAGSPPAGPPSTPPWEVTIVATGHIEVSGSPKMQNRLNGTDPDIQNLFMVAGTDLKLNGNADSTISGLLYATEQLQMSGNSNITGAVMAYNAPNNDGLVSANDLSGTISITYGCGLSIPNPGIIEVVSWKEL